MLFRSKSFNINRSDNSNSLNRSQSSPNLSSLSFDAKASLVSEKISLSKAYEISRLIKLRIENSKWKLKLDKKERRDTELRNWNDRCIYSCGVLQSIQERVGRTLREDIHEQEKYHCFVANFRGTPVGVLILTITEKKLLNAPKFLPDIPLILDISTHPGIRGGGISLIECAVNVSYQLGKNGVVQLTPIDESEGSYKYMGFNKIQSNRLVFMVLRPAESPKWQLIEGRYRFLWNV
ncbi:N-acetyltransferase [Xenorhabdus mauleonii]|uniref:N-acetyltransferase n=1 Tax=Xenorhabdus mauleonii TaxID=351675 RepID=A0A1I3KIQ4_9GAMM|nr:GNAT family N-acetyltransferase [Xenorhabdus mauleonii]PHM45065.1 N-acetyltransferase [Xenorhabdus mauleonii]SFI72363.1 hypothetical protein SAMN05421680_10399 [Xenorhabdus mauleonii]